MNDDDDDLSWADFSRFDKQETSEPSGADTGVYRWVAQKMLMLDVEVSAAGNVLSAHNQKQIMDELILHNEDIEKKHRFTLSALRAARDGMLWSMRQMRLDAMRKNLSHVANETVQQQLVALFALGSTSTEFTPDQCAKIVLKFVWQVRRKLYGVQVTNHLMGVFVGPQGGGKSWLVAKLCDPLRELTTDTTLSAITDDRNIDLFGNYIGVLDELEKADRADVGSLKAVISARMIDRRPMRENTFIKVPQNMTFIGTSNRDVGEAIVDETGNRRLVQIDIIGRDHPNIDAFWQAVNAFDWTALWRSVDEQAADPTQDIMDIIRAAQATHRSKSTIETWVEYMIATSHPYVSGDREWAKTISMHQQFRKWEDDFGTNFKTSEQSFSKTMTRLAKQNMVPFTKHDTNKAKGYKLSANPHARPVTPMDKMRENLHRQSIDDTESGDWSNE